MVFQNIDGSLKAIDCLKDIFVERFTIFETLFFINQFSSQGLKVGISEFEFAKLLGSEEPLFRRSKLLVHDLMLQLIVTVLLYQTQTSCQLHYLVIARTNIGMKFFPHFPDPVPRKNFKDKIEQLIFRSALEGQAIVSLDVESDVDGLSIMFRRNSRASNLRDAPLGIRNIVVVCKNLVHYSVPFVLNKIIITKSDKLST